MEAQLQPLEDFSLAELDQDGALEEAAARAFPLSRGEFLRKGLLGGGALVAAAALPDPATERLPLQERGCQILEGHCRADERILSLGDVAEVEGWSRRRLRQHPLQSLRMRQLVRADHARPVERARFQRPEALASM